MTVGRRLVRSGVLHYRSWGYALRETNGGMWQLDMVRPPEGMIGRMVIVDGIRTGFDMIDVVSIRAGPKARLLRWVSYLCLWLSG